MPKSERQRQHLERLHAARREGKIKSSGFSFNDIEPHMSFTEIGRELGMTRQGAEQCYRRAVQKFEKACKRRGINPAELLTPDYEAYQFDSVLNTTVHGDFNF